MIALAPGIASNLSLTAPLILLVAVYVLLWDDLVGMFERDRRDEFDEETTLEELLASVPERHLTLLAPSNAVGGGASPAREAMSATEGTES